jgi:hypothetical protein
MVIYWNTAFLKFSLRFSINPKSGSPRCCIFVGEIECSILFIPATERMYFS